MREPSPRQRGASVGAENIRVAARSELVRRYLDDAAALTPGQLEDLLAALERDARGDEGPP